MRASVFLGLLAVGALPPSSADACTSEPVSAAANVPVLPADGTVAPTNTSIWIPPPTDLVDGDVDPGTIVVEQNGVPVEVTAHPFLIDDELGHRGVRLEPTAALTPGATVVVRSGETIATRFTVGTGRDDTPPETPALIRVDVEGGYFGGFSCPESARVAIRTAAAPPTNELYVLASRSTTALTDRAFGLTANSWLIGIELDEGEHQMRVLAVDVANNVSHTDVPEFTVPGEQSGCAATNHAARAWPCIGLALLALRRRRRR